MNLADHSSEKHHWNQNDNANNQACPQRGLVSCLHSDIGNITTPKLLGVCRKSNLSTVAVEIRR